ncbi:MULTISPECIES: DUF1656 domain-containing protein [Bartonella]|uniref:DUF1656 domain-containing protein n=1 Tax=Bartonella choladocola TaxID=2750995 RepID=A0A1U9MKF3_9HYPH|nr:MULTISPECIES: DUF1656 domain-containing protein [Bartonella]AQT48210.1 Protein of unknown function (DUF1656) [Bartonella choladocola]MBH9976264.1 DUF1656 domain-containing protein [Bartonella choladocola]MBI0015872.1 DUF1656 domain-containing protein [Bartonella sp. B10834G3]MBI0141499.1 DUF1656 domain-containing protein [Bartonella choladocola]
MNPEVDIYGVYIPTIGILALVSYFLNVGLQRFILRKGLERFIWHHALFAAATYFIILSILSFIVTRI